jgi:hypothetical protein
MAGPVARARGMDRKITVVANEFSSVRKRRLPISTPTRRIPLSDFKRKWDSPGGWKALEPKLQPARKIHLCGADGVGAKALTYP